MKDVNLKTKENVRQCSGFRECVPQLHMLQVGEVWRKSGRAHTPRECVSVIRRYNNAVAANPVVSPGPAPTSGL